MSSQLVTKQGLALELCGISHFRDVRHGLCASKLPVQNVINQPGKVVENILKKRSPILPPQIAASAN